MKKTWKSFMATMVALSTNMIVLGFATSCSKHYQQKPLSFQQFSKTANSDGLAVVTSDKYKSFGVNHYWGSAILDPEKINIKLSGIVDLPTNFLNQDVNASFEQLFNYDGQNTITLVMIKGQKGSTYQQLLHSSRVIFNSWNHQAYVASNWSDYDNAPNYNVSQFFDNLKTNQNSLMALFSSNHKSDSLNYSGITKFSLNKISAKSYLRYSKTKTNFIISNIVKNGLAIDSDYTIILIGIDGTNNEKVINVTTHFSINADAPIAPKVDALVASSFNDTQITSGATPDQIKAELNSFLNSNNPYDEPNNFKKTWLDKFKVYRDQTETNTKTVTLSSLKINQIEPDGTIWLIATGSGINSNNLGEITYNIKTDKLITNGFHSALSPNKVETTYARFSKINYHFDSAETWGDNYLQETMLNIFRLTLISTTT